MSTPGVFYQYAIIVRWSDEDGQYVATTPDYPSMSWLADAEEAAVAGLLRVIADVLEDAP